MKKSFRSDLEHIRGELLRLAGEIDHALHERRYDGLSTEAAIRECLADGEWWTKRRVVDELRKGGSPWMSRTIGQRLGAMPYFIESRWIEYEGVKEYRLRKRSSIPGGP